MYKYGPISILVDCKIIGSSKNCQEMWCFYCITGHVRLKIMSSKHQRISPQSIFLELGLQWHAVIFLGNSYNVQSYNLDDVYFSIHVINILLLSKFCCISFLYIISLLFHSIIELLPFLLHRLYHDDMLLLLT